MKKLTNSEKILIQKTEYLNEFKFVGVTKPSIASFVNNKTFCQLPKVKTFGFL